MAEDPPPKATKTDVGANQWVIDDALVRLRIWGSDRAYPLPVPPTEVTFGSAETCSIRLIDPTGQISRTHARLVHEAGHWIMHDVKSKNGTQLDGSKRGSFALEPGVEIGLGGVTLIAESARLVALRGFLSRVLGWATSEIETVDLALRAVRVAATRRAALVVCGEGDLVPIALALHKLVLGDKPFVQCDPRRRQAEATVRAAENYSLGVPAMAAAIGGSLCVWSRRLPRDFNKVRAALREPSTRVQLIVCTHEPKDGKDFVAAPITIPSLAKRQDELGRIIDEYGSDAVFAIVGHSEPSHFTAADRDWVREHSSSSLIDIEKGTRRLVALHHAGTVTAAAAMLGMSNVALTEWIGRRRIPSGSAK